jgi:hypothetical protein
MGRRKLSDEEKVGTAIERLNLSIYRFRQTKDVKGADLIVERAKQLRRTVRTLEDAESRPNGRKKY